VQRRYISEWNHVAGGVANLDPRQIFGGLAELQVGLRRHPIGPAEDVEVVDVARPEIGFDRRVDRLDRDAEHGGTFAIDSDLDLRRGCGKRGVNADEPGCSVRRGDKVIGRLRQRCRPQAASVFQPHGKSARAADAGNRRRRHDDNAGIGYDREPLAKLGSNFIRCLTLCNPFRERLEDNVERGRV
jgi:hypothetical protein